MEHFESIESLWQTQVMAPVPDVHAIKREIQAFQRRRRWKLALAISMLAVCFFAMIWVMFHYHSQLWTTRLGEVLFILSAIYGIYLKQKKTRTYKHDLLLDAQAYLTHLQNENMESCTGTANQQLQCFSILIVGFFFYIYEYIHQDIQTLMTGYAALVLFLLFMWFVYRPFMVRWKKKDLQAFLNKLESIKSNFYEDH